jgi:thioredoxin 1
MIEPALKQVGKDYEGRVDVWKVNADEHPELLRALRIYGIPTIVSFNQGQEVARHTGVASQGALSSLFAAALSGAQPLRTGLTSIDRLLRAAIGLALLLLAYTGEFSGVYLFLAALSGVAFFSAVHDRCPVWKAITARLRGSRDQAKNEDESAV